MNAAAPVVAGEHPLELLRDPDRDHPRPPRLLGSGQQRAHDLGLTRVLGEPDHWMLLALAKRPTACRNRSPIGMNSAGEGIGWPRCCVRKTTTCPPTCRLGTYPLR